MRKLLAIMLALLPLAGCFGIGDTVEVRFTRVEATDFTDGRAGSCQVIGNVDNKTKYHLESLTFDLDKSRAALGALEANAHADDVTILTINPTPGQAPFSDCAAVARFVQQNGPGASALGCVMTGVAEGDCQKMVSFASDIDDAAVKKIADQEAAALAAEAAQLRAEAVPLARAAASLGQVDDTRLLDMIVEADSQFWSYNHYSVGSMHNVTQESAEAGVRVLRGEYVFNDNQQGWVRVTLYPGWSQLPCVEFWDFAGSCRPTRVKPDFAPSPPPAPPPPPEPAPDAAPATSDVAPAAPAATGDDTPAPDTGDTVGQTGH